MRQLVLVMVLLVAACGGSDADTTTTSVAPTTTTTPDDLVVVSSDGAVTLRIPTDAIPPGVDPAEIAVIPTTPDPEAPGIAEILAAGLGEPSAYRLEPDGVTFLEPVPAHLAFPDDGSLVTAFVVADGMVEPLAFDRDASEQSGDAVFLVPHTSLLMSMNRFHEVLLAPATAISGESFTVHISVMQTALTTGPFDLRGTLTATAPASPATQDAPAAVRALGPSHQTELTLTCDAVGVSQLEYRSYITLVPETAPGADPAVFGSTGNIDYSGRKAASTVCLDTASADPWAELTGRFGGLLQARPVTGTAGSSYEEYFELVLGCTLIEFLQDTGQLSFGRGFPRPVEPDDTQEANLLVGSGPNGYLDMHFSTIKIDPTGQTIDWSGINIGWGHGFGTIPPNGIETAHWITFWVDLSGGELPAEYSEDLIPGWMYTTEGTLERIGDSPPCEED